MSAYDQRQCRLMLERVEEFDSGKLALRKLISDLEALLWALQEIDKHWTEDFHKQWSILEEVYADALARKCKNLPPYSRKLVKSSIEKMKELLKQLLDDANQRQADG